MFAKNLGRNRKNRRKKYESIDRPICNKRNKEDNPKIRLECGMQIKEFSNTISFL